MSGFCPLACNQVEFVCLQCRGMLSMDYRLESHPSDTTAKGATSSSSSSSASSDQATTVQWFVRRRSRVPRAFVELFVELFVMSLTARNASGECFAVAYGDGGTGTEFADQNRWCRAGAAAPSEESPDQSTATFLAHGNVHVQRTRLHR